MRIGDFNTDEKVFIVAEIGNNHEGDFGLAKEMIVAAANAGVDAVKFQTIVPNRLVSAMQTDRVEQLLRFKFSYDQFAELAIVAAENRVMFMSTPFDLESAKFLEGLVPAFKIASSDNTFFPLLKAVAQTNKPVLMSIGLCNRDEVLRSVEYLRDTWGMRDVKDRLALLHCVSAYPTPDEEAGLNVIPSLAELGVVPGYSDHTLGTDAAVLSVAQGARVVEKHFTIDKNHSSFRDHQLSADPADMLAMVQGVRKAERMLGSSSIVCAPSESDGRQAYRRSVVAACDLAAGTLLTQEHLTWVRPGGGLAPGEETRLIGRKLQKSVRNGEQLTEGHVE